MKKKSVDNEIAIPDIDQSVLTVKINDEPIEYQILKTTRNSCTENSLNASMSSAQSGQRILDDDSCLQSYELYEGFRQDALTRKLESQLYFYLRFDAPTICGRVVHPVTKRYQEIYGVVDAELKEFRFAVQGELLNKYEYVGKY